MRGLLLRWRVMGNGPGAGRASLPAALGAPLPVQLLDPGKLHGGQVAVDGPDVRFELPDCPGAWDDAMHPRLGQQPAECRLGQRLAVALQEPELLDAPEPQLEPIAGRPAPLLLGRDRLARPELAAQQAARQ